jgi:hypothetical protein
MELLVSWSHLLDQVLADSIACSDLGNGLGGVGVDVLDHGLFAWLTVHNDDTLVRL